MREDFGLKTASIQLKKWDERLMRADDGLGFRKNWGRPLLED
jgi:hypothetical protein